MDDAVLEVSGLEVLLGAVYATRASGAGHEARRKSMDMGVFFSGIVVEYDVL